MRSITFAISKGGVGKSLITANVGAALAAHGKKVVLVEGDPNHPLQVILGINASHEGPKLDEVVRKDLDVQKAIQTTVFENLFLIPSGVSLQRYFDIAPINFAQKLSNVKTDFLIIDVPFPLGKAALLSMGVCQYFIPILTEDEFTLCVESAIDTIRLGKHLLNCIPLGFVLNRLKTQARFDEEFVADLENLLEISCITKIAEDKAVSNSYGGAGSSKAFLAYQRFPNSNFRRGIDEIVRFLSGDLPKPQKEDTTAFLKEAIKPMKI